MTGISITQVNADRGIAPGATKGAALHLRGIASGLAACGFSVHTYSARAPVGPFPVPVHNLDELQSATKTAPVYERYSLGHRGGLDFARSLGVPFVLEVNAPLVDEALTHRPGSVPSGARELEEELMVEADLVVTVSTALTHWVTSMGRRGPIETIQNGFEPDWFSPVDGAVKLGANGAAVDRIVFLGHPKPWHGAVLLVDLLVDLAARGHRPELLVVGGGTGADELLARAGDLGVNQQIVVTGPVEPDQVFNHLATATVGLAPYPKQDPFYFCPLKIVDYLAAGLPVVATRQGDIADLVRDAGLLVTPDDRPALADAVADLLHDQQRARAMGATGRRRAFDTMTWREVGHKTGTAILQLPHRPVEAATSS